MPSSPYPMLAVPDALALVLDQAVPLPPESVPLTNALGRILAADVHATGPLPPFPASIKDGYAVVAGDGPGIYPVVGAATAGHLPDFTLQPGQVAYITTGAPVPDGADAVVMVEETDPREDDHVHIRTAAKPGQDIRPVGVDVADGEVVLRKGDRPYWKEKAYRNALASAPDYVILMLGTNDTKPQNWKFESEFDSDYRDLVKSFLDLPGKPKVFVCRPCPVPEPGNFGINETNVRLEIPRIDAIAKDLKLGVIDMHAALKDHPEFLPDRVHPNDDGARLMAAAAFTALTGKPAPAK